MSGLLCFGYGYSARHYVAGYGARFHRVIATARGATPTGLPEHAGADICLFDGLTASAALVAAIAAADAILVSVPPAEHGDPVLTACADAMARTKAKEGIVYLSSVGVYGDHGGALVDETTPTRPTSARSRARLAAETAWLRLGQETGRPVTVLRLAGIYGPGRNALVQIAGGGARAVIKAGQVFNRIHVADIAQSIDAAFVQGAGDIFNVADDEPAPPQDVLDFAAGLLGEPPPPQIAWADAAPSLTPLARSFYADNRRVANARLKARLAVQLQFPTYREGLRALFAAGEPGGVTGGGVTEKVSTAAISRSISSGRESR
jgi:nucleoside-diphosphate-sugar epimerase